MRLLLLLVFACFGCPHPPTPPDPPGPLERDAATAIDGAPANCASFTGKYSVTDNPSTSTDQACNATVLKSVIHINPDDIVDPMSGQWNVTVFDEAGHRWVGLAKQLEDRPYVCRFVVEITGDPPASGVAVINRDFVLGENPGRGMGESVVRNGPDCTWQTVMVLTAL